MPSLPTVPTHFTLIGNVGSLDALVVAQLFTFDPMGWYCTERAVNGLKNSETLSIALRKP